MLLQDFSPSTAVMFKCMTLSYGFLNFICAICSNPVNLSLVSGTLFRSIYLAHVFHESQECILKEEGKIAVVYKSEQEVVIWQQCTGKGNGKRSLIDYE